MYRNAVFRTRRGTLLAVLILGAVAVLAVVLDQPLPPLAGTARASDGDSLRIGDTRIRLLGLDAPELAQSCTGDDGTSWPCGQVARSRMSELLASGPLDCRPEDRDQYDRLLAVCRVDGQDIAAVMVGEGLAISSGGYWNEEAKARREGLGIWSGGFDLPADWRRDQARPQGAFGWLGEFFR